jgi:hypothetical protein
VGIGTSSAPAPSTVVFGCTTGGAAGRGGGAADGVLRRGTTSWGGSCIEMRGIFAIGGENGILGDAGTLGALGGGAPMTSVPAFSGSVPVVSGR